ncbi:hypothetical protein [Pseudogemmobacter faecipullorum]|uniref:Tail assembly chaperone n=1 Tax=Pseudogemmobacter faecipullorum TaxID=2755041 RepID=A0ABS8CRI1_9RHOB|nr:hypothetical protein [Pseudogemmobacter faecipullorum]MCB5411778.1 hypothetical protein [Pseudogemmobacter faecipullorum]
MDIQSLKKDVAASTEGQWVGDIPEMGQLRLRVRGENSPKVAALRARKLRAVPKDKRGRDGMPIYEEVLRVTTEVLHEVVLLDWDGLTNGGKPVKYDPELAKQWITDPDFQDFADAVAWASKIVANGQADQVEEAAGN